MSDVAEEEWKRRFALFALARLGSVALLLLGIGVGATGLIRPGGWPVVGFLIGALGVAEGIIVPRLLRRRWTEK
ncbi:MAG: hypothetical protein ABIQ98_01225 [Sphingomicrobium sp.]